MLPFNPGIFFLFSHFKVFSCHEFSEWPFMWVNFNTIIIGHYSFSRYAKVSEKLTFLNPWSAHVRNKSNLFVEAESVLIVYPHGCRILHRLLRDVAAIISSYGIQVHMALLESSKLDGTGGISRFYEETISNSSCTLVLCTETSGNLTI